MKRGTFRQSARKDDAPSREEGKVHGFLLHIRALASFAIRWPEHPAALRVLTVLVEYMDHKTASCRVSRFTLADRLGMSRQGVQQHLKLLAKCGDIQFKSETGSLTTFRLNPEYLESLSDAKDGREGSGELELARTARKAERRRRRHDVKGARPEVAPSIVPVSVDVLSGASSELAGGARPEVAGGASCTLQEVQAQNLHKETSFTPAEERCEREVGAGAPPSPDGSAGAAPLGRFFDGEFVQHVRFGRGKVLFSDGNKVTVDFGTRGTTRVVDSFLQRAI